MPCLPSQPLLRLRVAVLATILAGACPAEEPPTLAVLDLQGAFQMPRTALPRFANQPAAPRQRPLGDLLVHRIDHCFHATGRFRLVERAQLGAVLKEGALQHRGLVDDATAVALGRQLGARFVLVGSYSGAIAHAEEVKEHLLSADTRKDFYPARLEVRLRMVSTEDGSILEPLTLNAEARSPQASAAFDLLMEDFSQVLDRALALRYPLSGYVIKVLSAKEVLADLGRARGVAAGDVFRVVEAGPDVTHPVTGKRIPGERKVAGELVVTEAGPESSTLRVSSGHPGLRPGAVLERKPR